MKTAGAKDHEVRKALFVLVLVEASASEVGHLPVDQLRQPAGVRAEQSRDGVVAAGDIVTGEADTPGASLDCRTALQVTEHVLIKVPTGSPLPAHRHPKTPAHVRTGYNTKLTCRRNRALADFALGRNHHICE